MAGLATAQRYTLRIVGKVVVLRILLKFKKGKVAFERRSVPGKVNSHSKIFEASQKATKRETHAEGRCRFLMEIYYLSEDFRLELRR